MKTVNSEDTRWQEPDSLDWQFFFRGLNAAVIADVNFEIGTLPGDASLSGIATPSKLAELEARFHHQYDTSSRLPLLPALGTPSESPSFPDRYWAAVRAFQLTGNVPMVLDGLRNRLRSKKELASLLWSTWAYLAVLVSIGCIGLLIFFFTSIPIIERIRSDLPILLPQWASIPETAAVEQPTDLRVEKWLCAAIALSVLMVVLAWFKGISMMPWWLARGRYESSRSASRAVMTKRALLKSPLPAGEAFGLACTLAGTTETEKRRIGNSLGPELSRASAIGQFDIQTQQCHHDCLVQFSRLSAVLPNVLIILIGGSGVLAYALILFRPLVSLLFELAAPIS